MVAIENLAGRIAANSVIPYPPGIPMLLSGENFGDANSPQIGYSVRCSPGTTTSWI
jgi:arginine decarboxylase